MHEQEGKRKKIDRTCLLKKKNFLARWYESNNYFLKNQYKLHFSEDVYVTAPFIYFSPWMERRYIYFCSCCFYGVFVCLFSQLLLYYCAGRRKMLSQSRITWQTAGRADNLNNMYLIHSTSSSAEIKSKVNKSEHWFLPIEQDSAEFLLSYLPIVDGNYNSLVREKQELMGIKVI